MNSQVMRSRSNDVTYFKGTKESPTNSEVELHNRVSGERNGRRRAWREWVVRDKRLCCYPRVLYPPSRFARSAFGLRLQCPAHFPGPPRPCLSGLTRMTHSTPSIHCTEINTVYMDIQATLNYFTTIYRLITTVFSSKV